MPLARQYPQHAIRFHPLIRCAKRSVDALHSLPERRALAASIVFCISALLVVPYFETIRVWYPVLLQQPALGHLIGVSVMAVPPIVVLLWPRKRVPAVPLGA